MFCFIWSNFYLNFLVYYQNLSFFTKLAISPLLDKFLTWAILFPAAARAAAAVAKLVIPGISPLISFILALREVLAVKLVILDISPLTLLILALREALVTKLVLSGILPSSWLILALYTSFSTSSFLIHNLVYLN